MSIFNKFPKNVKQNVNVADFCTDDGDVNMEDYYLALEDEEERQLMESEWESYDRRHR